MGPAVGPLRGTVSPAARSRPRASDQPRERAAALARRCCWCRRRTRCWRARCCPGARAARSACASASWRSARAARTARPRPSTRRGCGARARAACLLSQNFALWVHGMSYAVQTQCCRHGMRQQMCVELCAMLAWSVREVLSSRGTVCEARHLGQFNQQQRRPWPWRRARAGGRGGGAGRERRGGAGARRARLPVPAQRRTAAAGHRRRCGAAAAAGAGRPPRPLPSPVETWPVVLHGELVLHGEVVNVCCASKAWLPVRRHAPPERRFTAPVTTTAPYRFGCLCITEPHLTPPF